MLQKTLNLLLFYSFTFICRTWKIEVQIEWREIREQQEQRRKKFFSRLIAQLFGLPTDRPWKNGLSSDERAPWGSILKCSEIRIRKYLTLKRRAERQIFKEIAIYGMAGAISLATTRNYRLTQKNSAERVALKPKGDNNHILWMADLPDISTSDKNIGNHPLLLSYNKQWMSIRTQFWWRRWNLNGIAGTVLLVEAPSHLPSADTW